MQDRWTGRILLVLVALVLSMAACGPDEEALAAEARAEAWGLIQEAHTELEQKRQELAELEARVAAGPEALELEEGADVEAAFAELEEQASSLAREVASDAESFVTELVTFINENPMTVGEEPTPEQAAAFRMKSSEDLVLAMEWIEEGGDWKRAQDIVERALEIDPENQELKDRLAWIEEMRFITKERFSQLEKGMTQEQVRELVGPVNLRNVREFPGDRVGWFYRKDPDTEGGAAGVFFQKERGVWKVYQLDYDAIETAE